MNGAFPPVRLQIAAVFRGDVDRQETP